MRIRPKYIILCVILTLISLTSCYFIYNVTMRFSQSMKLNSVLSDPKIWTETELFITQLGQEGDGNEYGDDSEDYYIGNITYVTGGKYIAYGKDKFFGSGSYFSYFGNTEKYKKVSIFYKNDYPELVRSPRDLSPYIVLLIILFVVELVVIIVSAISNKFLREESYSNGNITIMDVPMLLTIIGIIACAVSGYFVGTTSIGAQYTEVNESVVAEYRDNLLTIEEAQKNVSGSYDD